MSHHSLPSFPATSAARVAEAFARAVTSLHVIVADPDATVRARVRRLLEQERDFRVTEAASADELVAAVEASPADIAVIDLDLPPSGGVAATRRLAELSDAQAVVWSNDPIPETVIAAIHAGAKGYVRKELSAGVVRSLRGLMRGEAPLPRDLAALVVEAFRRAQSRELRADREPVLSKRERAVLELVAEGARNKDVAAELGISEFTVKRHMQNIFQKLGVTSRDAAVGFYRSLESRGG